MSETYDAGGASPTLTAGMLYFDARWYLRAYPDVKAAGLDPVRHYMTSGHLEGRDPNADFSTRDYLQANPDLDATKVNAFLHFVLHGASEGRKVKP